MSKSVPAIHSVKARGVVVPLARSSCHSHVR